MLENRNIIILISIIWGLGLALLFRKICTNDQCVINKLPASFSGQNNTIYDRNGKCYRLLKYPSQCVY